MTTNWNPAHAPPSYKEMGTGKPKHPKQRIPLRYIECYKCHKTTGTLVRIDNKYVHADCNKQEN